MTFASMAGRQSGKMSRSGCSTIRVSKRPEGMKKTGAGRGLIRPKPIQSLSPGCPDGSEISPHAPLGRRPQGSEEGTRQGARNGQYSSRAVGGDQGQGRGIDPAGRQAALRKLERAYVERRGAGRSVAYHRPGCQRRLSLAGDPVRTVQDAERRGPRGDEASAPAG